MRQPHPTISLFNPAISDYCDIDAGMADLIATLWRNDIQTMQCCQEITPGCMWIEFGNSIDAERFLDMAAPRYDALHERVMEIAPPGEWEYEVHIVNINEDIDEDGEFVPTGEGPLYLMLISIRFPVTDYPLILANVLEAEKRASDGD